MISFESRMFAPRANLTFVFMRWRRQPSASAENLFYRVTAELRTWRSCSCLVPLYCSKDLFAPVCSKLEASPQTLAKVDMRRFVVSAWCTHPDLIPCEKIIFIPEPELMHVYGPPELMQVFASAS
jgi:hypothetical protein